MSKLSLLMLGILGTGVLAAGCGGDDDDDGGGQETTFNVTLTTAAEVPACGTGGPNATGSAQVKISADSSTITVSNLTYSGLSGSGTPNLGHIHYAAEGMAGMVVLNFGTSLASPINATFTEDNYPGGTAPLPADFATLVTDMKAGKTYINLHTPAPGCPMGEIRGQIK